MSFGDEIKIRRAWESVMRKPPFGASFTLSTRQCARLHFGTREGWARCRRESANHYKDILLMPLDKDPSSYEWPVSGRDVLIFLEKGIPEQLVDSTCRALLQRGARNIMVFADKTENCRLIGDLAKDAAA